MTRTASVAHLAVLAAILFAAAIPASAQARVVFRCKHPGKYKLFFPGHPDHYCYDEKLYTVSGMPPHVRAYFAEKERKNEEIRQANQQYQADFRARWEARRAAERQQSTAVASAASPNRPVR